MTADTSPAQRQVILYVCCMGMMNLSFSTVAPATNLTAIAGEFGMNHAEKGLLLSSAFWGVTASLLVAGPLADRCGFRLLLCASALLEAIGDSARLELIPEMAHFDWANPADSRFEQVVETVNNWLDEIVPAS